MSTRDAVEYPTRIPSLLSFGGATVASIWAVSGVTFALGEGWESHKTASYQWFLELGTAFLLAIFAILARAKFASRLRARFTVFDGAVRVSAIVTFLAGFITAAGLIALAIAPMISRQADASRGAIAAHWIFLSLVVFGLSTLSTKSPMSDVRSFVGYAAGRLSLYRRSAHDDGYDIALTVGSIVMVVASLTIDNAAPAWVLQGITFATFGADVVRRRLHIDIGFGVLFRALLLGLLSIIIVATTLWLTIHGRRYFALLIGVIQGIMWLRLRHTALSSWRIWTAMILTSMVAWAICVGLMFTSFADWLLAASEATATAPIAFTGAFTIVSLELSRRWPYERRAMRTRDVSTWVLAGVAFILLAFRTDGLLADWIPYHRSFWVGPADFVRAGGWLLWDVPSQYGFLSALSLAVWPAKSTWQALYEQLGVVLTFDAMLLFWLLRHGRRGATNFWFAGLVTATSIFASEGARVPFGWRLYPQAGLRFTGFLMLAAIAFLVFLQGENDARRRLLLRAGYAVWLLSLLWSFESGVIASFIWIPFVTFTVASDIRRHRDSARRSLRRIAAAVIPFFALPAATAAILEIWYRMHLGHGPDWQGFTEFSLAYQAQDVAARAISATGPGWILVGLCVAYGAIALRALQRGSSAAPLLAACWCGIWGVASYYISEGYDNHINVLTPVFATLIAIALAAERVERRSCTADSNALERAIFAPIFVLVIAAGFSDPSEVASIRVPGMPNVSFNSTSEFDTNSSEIRKLTALAHVAPGDRVIYPDSNWRVKIDLGLEMPFMRDSNGEVVQQTAWLPISPVGPFDVLMTLPFERRTTYLSRYFSQVGETGWLFSYHQAVNCRRYIPELATVDVYRSENYELGRCVRRGGTATNVADK